MAVLYGVSVAAATGLIVSCISAQNISMNLALNAALQRSLDNGALPTDEAGPSSIAAAAAAPSSGSASSPPTASTGSSGGAASKHEQMLQTLLAAAASPDIKVRLHGVWRFIPLWPCIGAGPKRSIALDQCRAILCAG